MDVLVAVITLLLHPDVSVSTDGSAGGASPGEVVPVTSAAGIALSAERRVEVIKPIVVAGITGQALSQGGTSETALEGAGLTEVGGGVEEVLSSFIALEALGQ